MPVGVPPLGGPLGRSRGRLSASSLTTYLRCPRQWLLGYQVGLQGPTRPSQIVGVVLEDALCELLMMHPPVSDTYESLSQWAHSKIHDVAKKAHERGAEAWNESLWTAEGTSWDEVLLSSFEQRIGDGLGLFLEEVQACFDADGGPYLDANRNGHETFSIPSPSWGSSPSFPRPEKVPDIEKMKWETKDQPTWSIEGEPITWHEAWECARPWVKDPRVHQPQRLYHPEGWASGELDLVLRWDGRIRLVDIKSGRSGSAFSSSLEHQLRFYAWLWNQTHEGELVSSMEGWYLNGGERVNYDAPDGKEIESLTTFYRTQHEAMQAEGEAVLAFPRTPEQACDGSAAGCVWCSVSKDESGWQTTQMTAWIESIPSVSLRSPYQSLASIQGRVSVRGSLGGEWSLPNHFGEQVLGAVLVSGQKHVTVEESEPGAFSDLHDLGGEVEIHNAMPGVWRDQPRVYLDDKTTITTVVDSGEQGKTELTRLGLLRTRANVSGHVLSIRKRSGVRLDGKPWTMLTFILWDGGHVAEVVAFGSSINQRLLKLSPGDLVSMTGVEIGWRSGILQLRIDNRKTRFETSTQPSFKE